MKKSRQAQNLAISKKSTILKSYQADILGTKPTHEMIIFTKFHTDWRKKCGFFTIS